uniref:Uncharacterized protein n=1 Tax=Setaria italica TaxID=4555 RepID=K3XTQ8_SETIT
MISPLSYLIPYSLTGQKLNSRQEPQRKIQKHAIKK